MNTPPASRLDARSLDIFGIMSTTTAGIGLALALSGQLHVAERLALHARTGHPIAFDGLVSMAPVPGLICALLAVGLGVAGIHTRDNRRAWSIVGVVVGTIAVACSVSGLPVSLIPDPMSPRGL